MKRLCLFAVAVAVSSCDGTTLNVPVSVPLGATGISDASAPGAVPVRPRNVGTQSWLIPAPAGNLPEFAGRKEEWTEARKRVDVFGFYFHQAYHHPGYDCGNTCGPNSFPALRDVVPGGMFKWVQDQGMLLALETASVKEHACTEVRVRQVAADAVRALDNIASTGATVTYIAQDEPFTSGVSTGTSPFPGHQPCGMSPEETAQLVKLYVDQIHVRYPDIQVGLIEPYPHFTPDLIISFVLEMEHAGSPIPFFHLDFDQERAVREKRDTKADLRRLRDFFTAKDIPFGVIVFGADGSTNERFAAGAMANAVTNAAAIGVTSQTILQSWSPSDMTDPNALHDSPDAIPMATLFLRILNYLKIPPAS